MFDLTLQDLNWAVKDGKEYRTLLQIPSFQVKAGEKLAISGTSGSGKTSFLKLITGLLHPSSGSLIWKSNKETLDFTNLSARAKTTWRRENSGIIFQDFQLIPTLTLLENVLIPLTFSHVFISKTMKEKARNLLKSVGLTDYSKSTQVLSRGEMQRVAFCRAIIHSPSLLFADEPTASLDKENSEIIYQLLTEYCNKEKASLFIISHDTDFCHKMDKILFLEKGLMVNKGAK